MPLDPHIRHLTSAATIAEAVCWVIFVGSVGLLMVGLGGH